jgi:hypothetical protein
LKRFVRRHLIAPITSVHGIFQFRESLSQNADHYTEQNLTQITMVHINFLDVPSSSQCGPISKFCLQLTMWSLVLVLLQAVTTGEQLLSQTAVLVLVLVQLLILQYVSVQVLVLVGASSGKNP